MAAGEHEHEAGGEQEAEGGGAEAVPEVTDHVRELTTLLLTRAVEYAPRMRTVCALMCILCALALTGCPPAPKVPYAVELGATP